MAAAQDKTAGKGWIGALLLVTLVALGTGGALGAYLLTSVERSVGLKQRDEQDKAVKTLSYTGDLVVRSVGSVVVNLTDSNETWVRLESSVIFKGGGLTSPDAMLAEIRADVIAYMRTLSMAQIEGASGLQHLREDLNERLALRTKGQARELIIETLVVQ